MHSGCLPKMSESFDNDYATSLFVMAEGRHNIAQRIPNYHQNGGG